MREKLAPRTQEPCDGGTDDPGVLTMIAGAYQRPDPTEPRRLRVRAAHPDDNGVGLALRPGGAGRGAGRIRHGLAMTFYPWNR